MMHPVRIFDAWLQALTVRYRPVNIVRVLWATIAIGIGLLFLLCFYSFKSACARLEDQVASYAHLIAAHDRYAFTVADMVALSVMDRLTWNDFNGNVALERKEQIVHMLQNYQDRFPAIASFTIIDADGIRRAGIVNTDGTDLSRRSYFLAAKAGITPYISGVEDGMASGKPGIHISRRFNAEAGRFGGVVEINLASNDAFFPFYKSLQLDHGFTVGLRDAEKSLITFPAKTPSAECDQAVHEAIAKGERSGVIRVSAEQGGIKRVLAFERLPGTNIYATASQPLSKAITAPWYVYICAFFAAIASLVGGVFASVAVSRTRHSDRARDNALFAEQETRKLVQKLNSVVEDERRSIAIEIHDDLNANLIAVRLESQQILALTALEDGADTNAKVREHAESIVKLTRSLYASGRSLVTRLRPEVIDMLGLKGAVEEMVRNYQATHASCDFTFQCSGDVSALDDSLAIAAFRLIQEALSNIVKHADATSASVSLRFETVGKELLVTVSDDGCGFDPVSPNPGIGLLGMQERVIAFNGSIKITSHRGEGTKLFARFPTKT